MLVKPGAYQAERSVLGMVLKIVLVLCFIGGVVLMIVGFKGTTVESMPVPSNEINAPDAPVVMTDGRVKISNSDNGDDPRAWDNARYGNEVTSMDREHMDNGSVFIPSVGAYMLVRAESTFVSSQYKGFNTLRIPNNPHRGVFYADGPGLTSGEEGTTLVASHIAMGSTRGALTNLYKIQAGAAITTKDANGSSRDWKTVQVFVRNHTDFPQEFFAQGGQRRLVITTCGGSMNTQGIYQQNIFVVATPIDQ